MDNGVGKRVVGGVVSGSRDCELLFGLFAGGGDERVVVKGSKVMLHMNLHGTSHDITGLDKSLNKILNTTCTLNKQHW